MTFNNPLRPEQYRELKQIKKRWDAKNKRRKGSFKALRKYFELQGKLNSKLKFKLKFFRTIYSDFTVKTDISIREIHQGIQFGIKEGHIRIARRLASGNNLYEWVCG